jgi:hypothetical protein
VHQIQILVVFSTPKTKCLSIGIIIPVTHILQKSRFQIVNITIYDKVYFAKCSAPNIPGYTTFQRQVATHLRSPPPNLQCQRQTYGNNRRMMLKLAIHIYIYGIYSVYIYIYTIYSIYRVYNIYI